MSLVDDVAALGPDIAGRADAMEAAGRLDPELARSLAGLGVFRMAVPSAIGGLELPVADQLRVMEAAARHDGSTGWCVMIGATTAVLSAWLPEATARQIYGTDPLVITGGAYAPNGRAVVVDGGFEVTGRWEWGSGSSHCSWLLGGALVVDGDGELVTDDGVPMARLCFAPADLVEVVPNWDVLGMRGTGSNDLRMEAVVVPDEHTVSLTADRPWAGGPLYRFPPFGLLALGIAAVSLGVGRAAIDAVVDVATSKTPTGSRRALGDRSTVRAELARCEAQVRAARALLFTSVDDAWGAAVAGRAPDLAARASLRLAATHVAVTVADVTARLHRLTGGTGVRHGTAIERCFRDAHVATAHLLVSANLFETVGTVLLGGEPGFLEL